MMSDMSNHPALIIRQIDLRQPKEAARATAFVRAHPDATPFHLPAWLLAIEKGCGQKARMLVAEDGEGQLAGLVPLSEIRSLLFGKALVSSGFAVGGGVLAESENAAQQLLYAALDHARREGFPTVEMRGGAVHGGDWHVDSETYLGFARDLASDDESELLAIPRKQRAEVRKALGFELTVETGSAQRDRNAHFGVYATSVRNLGTPVFPRALFDAILDAFGDEADILTVRQGGRALASVLSLYWRGTVMPYWGGGTSDARSGWCT